MPFPQRSLQVLAYAALSSLFWAGCTSDSGVGGTSVDGAGGDGSNVGASAGGTGDTLQCTAPTVPCAEGSSTTCVDVEESAAHCGGCNQACPNGQVCLQGTCSVSAGTGASPGAGGAAPGPTGQG